MEDCVREIKNRIDNDDLESIKSIVYDIIQDNMYKGRYEYMWQRCYIHACLKKKQEIKDWFLEVFETFSDVSKIALKPTLLYGKYLR